METHQHWYNSRRLCQNMTEGAELASIHDYQTNDFLIKLARRRDFWVGGLRETEKNGGAKTWQWADGSLWDFVDWGKDVSCNWRPECC